MILVHIFDPIHCRLILAWRTIAAARRLRPVSLVAMLACGGSAPPPPALHAPPPAMPPALTQTPPGAWPQMPAAWGWAPPGDAPGPAVTPIGGLPQETPGFLPELPLGPEAVLPPCDITTVLPARVGEPGTLMLLGTILLIIGLIPHARPVIPPIRVTIITTMER